MARGRINSALGRGGCFEAAAESGRWKRFTAGVEPYTMGSTIYGFNARLNRRWR